MKANASQPGEVLDGMEVVRAIEALGTESGKVLKEIIISESGVLEETPASKSADSNPIRSLFSWRSKSKKPTEPSPVAPTMSSEEAYLPQDVPIDPAQAYIFVSHPSIYIHKYLTASPDALYLSLMSP